MRLMTTAVEHSEPPSRRRRFSLRRQPLPLPYNSPPRWSALHIDPTVHTAGEMVAATEHAPAAA